MRSRHRFNSRPSCDGRHHGQSESHAQRVSIHARRETGDKNSYTAAAAVVFQFTPVVRRATGQIGQNTSKGAFQFTPVVRRATRWRKLRHYLIQVSIHARRETGDAGDVALVLRPSVSIHARRETGDLHACVVLPSCLFQFTPVVRRATLDRLDYLPGDSFQFTPVVRRATGPDRRRSSRASFNSRPS